jgi:ABC-type iron transport system FetAB ATPase subunit
LAAIGQRVRAATDGLVRPIVMTTDNTTSPDDDVIVLNDPKQRTHVSYCVSTPSLYSDTARRVCRFPLPRRR